MKSILFKPSNIKKTYMNYKLKQTRSVTSATLRQNKKRWFFVRYHQTLNAILHILLRFNQGLLGFPVPFCVRAFTDRHTAVLTIAVSPGPYSIPSGCLQDLVPLLTVLIIAQIADGVNTF